MTALLLIRHPAALRGRGGFGCATRFPGRAGRCEPRAKPLDGYSAIPQLAALISGDDNDLGRPMREPDARVRDVLVLPPLATRPERVDATLCEQLIVGFRDQFPNRRLLLSITHVEDYGAARIRSRARELGVGRRRARWYIEDDRDDAGRLTTHEDLNGF